MPHSLDAALHQVRDLVLDRDRLVKAIAAGRRRTGRPQYPRAELRPVTLKSGEMLQISVSDGQRPHVRNVPWEDAATELDRLLAEPYGNWHVQTTEETVQLRVTKKGNAQLHRRAQPARRDTAHDRQKRHLLDPSDELFRVLGANAAKRRQVDAFLRYVDAAIRRDDPSWQDGPLRVADLGCGNAYLTFAAYRYLSEVRGLDVRLVGVDVRADQVARNTAIAEQLGCQDQVRFVQGTIAEAPTPSDGPPHLVLALHACDTATDEALARAVGWNARHILAAPCCHHDISSQLRRNTVPDPYRLVTRHGILRERFADVLTDALRAAVLRRHGYRVEVTEFIDSQHTPRNVMLRADRTGVPGRDDEYQRLVDQWRVQPALAALLEQTALPAKTALPEK